MKRKMLRLILCMAALIFCGSVAHSFAFKLPDTGQTKCYQGVSPYAEIPCAGTGQDGAYNINTMSFTDNGNGTVTDNNTGLIWQKEDDGTPRTWDAAGSYCAALGTDWRLPTKKELITIVDYSVPFPGPTINAIYFPKTKSSSYSTATIYEAITPPTSAWHVYFVDGSVYPDSMDYNGLYVRCVRGSQYPTQSLIDNGNGTVTDNATGLIWQQAEGGSMNWESALSYCEGLALAGASDWRLPDIKELEALTDDTRYMPAIATAFFPNAYAYFYWSSTTGDLPIPEAAQCLDFGHGFVGRNGKEYDGVYVRCVRGRQVGPQAPRFPLDISYRDNIKYRMCDPLYPGDGEHKGIDIMAPVNTAVYPVCDGIVVLNNTHTEDIRKYKTPYDKYFNSFLIINHNCNGQTLYGYYGHLKSNLNKDSEVKVEDNTPIGFIREAYSWPDIRNPNQDHLHLGINIDKYENRNWGIAPRGLSCTKLEKMGWRDPIDYFEW